MCATFDHATVINPALTEHISPVTWYKLPEHEEELH